MKNWPADAVMIVAANAGQQITAHMESEVPAKCRDCKADVVADSFTIREAEQLPSRHGRPIRFFCIDCATKRNVNQITEFYDHRKEA